MSAEICKWKTSWGEWVEVKADLTEASAPILLWGDEDQEWVRTPFQSSDASCSEPSMRELVERWMEANGG